MRFVLYRASGSYGEAMISTWGRHVFDLEPAERALNLNVLFSPDASESLDRSRELPQPRRLAGRIHCLELPLAIRPNDHRQRLAGGVCLEIWDFDRMSLALIPLGSARACTQVGAIPARLCNAARSVSTPGPSAPSAHESPPTHVWSLSVGGHAL